MYKRILPILFLISVATQLSFAQQATIKSDDVIDDWKLEQSRNDYWNNILTSGDEKDIHVVERKAYDAMHNIEDRTMFKSLASAAWQPVGSSVGGHSSGRIVSIAVDPQHPKVVYIAAAGGGIWKCADITATPPGWIPLTDRLPTTNFGAVAINPQNTNIIFAGSGEPAGDNYQGLYGFGIYRSTDGGMNWTNVCDTAGVVCAEILIDSTNPQIIYVASADTFGILKSTDGGDTWRKYSVGGKAPLSISYSSLAPNYLYAGCINSNQHTYSNIASGSVYRSTNAGVTWTAASITGLPGNAGRVAVACAPSAPNIVYASFGNTNNSATLGLWLSIDSGKTWTVKNQFNSANPESPTNANPLGMQMPYCNSLVVRPGFPQQVLVGGLDIYWSNNSGTQLNKVSDWRSPPTASQYVHADIHHLAFFGGTLYAVGDGGLASTTTIQQFQSWNSAINEGLATLQFVGADANKAFSFTSGGCQDNGTLRASVNAPDFTLTHSGDGGRGWVSPDDSSIVYTTYVYTTFFKSLNGGVSFGDNLIQPNTALFNDQASGGTHAGEGAPFYPAYDVSSDGTVVAFGGNAHIWISMNGGDDAFNDHHSDKGIGQVYTIHVSQHNPSFMWAGGNTYQSGGQLTNLWRTADEGYTWTSVNLKEPVLGITSDPNNDSIVYVVTNGTSAAYKHFWVSKDAGATFTSPSNALAQFPCFSIAVSPKDGTLFVGSDKGVLFSQDHGVSWNPMMNGMPYARVTSLRVKGPTDNILFASTYGRGLFSVDISSLGVADSHTSPALELDPIVPNPLSTGQATIHFTLTTSGYSELRLFDLLGREIKVLDKNFYDAGAHSVRFASAGLSAGTYVVRLISGGTVASQKVVIE
ncbi:MAG TPA: T9SS type A sorting domain-containing protein [Candidatus Kapabacteria bacterium]|nr:T9SS type A sorting domain-containing protein [Candidatus Kapabacteria bacterium]